MDEIVCTETTEEPTVDDSMVCGPISTELLVDVAVVTKNFANLNWCDIKTVVETGVCHVTLGEA